MSEDLEFRHLAERCRKDPEFFVREILGDDPWEVQVKIMESVRDNPNTAVPSCHSSGKSWDAARIVLWFLFSHPNSIVITTAPTDRQVRGILWKEIRAAHAAANEHLAEIGAPPLGGECLVQQLNIAPDWFAIGFTAPDWDENRFQGFHAQHILVVRDEAAGISTTISEQIDSLLAGGHSRNLEIGNPTDPFSAFKKSCDDPEVSTIHISAYDTPNFTEPGITEEDIETGYWEMKLKQYGKPLPHPELITPGWAALQMRRWGKDSPAYRVRVKGLFADEIEGAYYAQEMRRAEVEGRLCRVPADSRLRTFTAWDIGRDDANAIWWIQVNGNEIRWIDYYVNRGLGLPHYVGVVKERGAARGLVYEAHFAPHDMGVKEYSNNKARVDTAAELGLVMTVLENLPLMDGIDAVRNLLGRSWFDVDHCEEGIKALRAYQAEEDLKTGERKTTPLHNWASHGADAARTFAMGFSPESLYGEQDLEVDTSWIV